MNLADFKLPEVLHLGIGSRVYKNVKVKVKEEKEQHKDSGR